MIDFTTRLQKELDTQLLEIEAQEEDFIIKTQKSKDCINQTLALLKTFILQYQFKSKEEEILFFKEIKPDIFSKSVYYKKITTDRQNLNFVGFYFYLFVYQLLAVFIFVLLKTYPLSK